MPIVNITGSSQSLVKASSTAVVYRGFSLRETSGSASALVRLFDNASTAAGNILDEISLTASQSAREIYNGAASDFRLLAADGIYVQVVSGAVAGSVRYEYA